MDGRLSVVIFWVVGWVVVFGRRLLLFGLRLRLRQHVAKMDVNHRVVDDVAAVAGFSTFFLSCSFLTCSTAF